MSEREVQYPRHVNPTPDGAGMLLYEHWEQPAAGQTYLLAVSSTATGMVLKPGDFILERRWGPASVPTIYNRAWAEWERRRR